MKIKTIELNTTSSPAIRKRTCWTSYHEWINSPNCNKAMTIVFFLAILGMFFGIVILTIARTNVAAPESRLGKSDTFNQSCRCNNELVFESAKLQKDPTQEELERPESNCTIKDCKVTCRDIAEQSLSREILTLAVEENECSFIELELEKCKFTGNYIKEGWLSELNLKVKKLDIIDSNLNYIVLDAFNSTVFKGTLTSLTIDNSQNFANSTSEFTVTTKGAFNGLTSLSSLSILNMPALKVYDDEAFQFIADSLTQLRISRIANAWTPRLLLHSVKLKKITTVELTLNRISRLNGTSFKGIEDTVKSLILANSNIESIAEDTFSGFKSLVSLYLQYNLLTTIPPALFNNLISIQGFAVDLQGNKWDCECEILFEVQQVFINNRNVFRGSIQCASPLSAKGLEVVSVDLCAVETKETSITMSISMATEPECRDSTETIVPCSTELPVTNATTTTTRAPTTRAPITTEVPTTIETTTKAPLPTIEPTDTPTEPPTTVPTTASPTDPPTTPTTKGQTDSPTELPVNDTTAVPTDAPTIGDETTPHPTPPPPTTTTLKDEPELTTPRYYDFGIECAMSDGQSKRINFTDEWNRLNVSNRLSGDSLNDTLRLYRPQVLFDFDSAESESEVNVVFENIYDNHVLLLYYPAFLDASELNNQNVYSSINCQIVANINVRIRDLIPSSVYTFCALIRHQVITTPFQCKSYQTETPFSHQTWIYQEQKVFFLSLFIIIGLVSVLVGTIMTYFLIRRMPTLMKGSKRVVMVNNKAKDVIVLAGGSRSNSWQRESTTPIKAEPAYLTPLPRLSFEKPSLVRCSSDTSLSARSYISVSRAPPRFSQVFQPSDFKRELPRRCGSFPYCQPPENVSSLPHCQPSCHSPNAIPPPLPRRSIASTVSSSETRKQSKNSIYRRQPSRIEDETENDYNFII